MAGRRGAERSREELARQIRDQHRENERLRDRNARLERDLERVKRERDRLRDELEAARRSAKRQAAPFSKGEPKAAPQRPGRKAGRRYGPRRWRPRPTHIDAVVDVQAPTVCPHCAGTVVGTGGVREQYQADLPPVRPHVTLFRCHVGCCQHCRRRVVGRDSWQTSTATGAAASQVGPNTVAWAAWLHTGLGVPLAKVAIILRTGFGLTITAGGLAQALHRRGARASPTYHALVHAVQRSPVVARAHRP